MEKENGRKQLLFILIGLFFAVVITIFLSFFQCYKDRIVFQILFEIDKALYITVGIGSIVKFFGDGMYAIVKNNRALTKLGITKIIPGKLPVSQKDIMFGLHDHEKPKKLRLLFLSGENFFKDFADEIKRLVHSDCDKIEILLVNDRNPEGNAYIKRLERIESKDGIYRNCLLLTKNMLNWISENTEKKVEVRYYIDEYCDSFRIAYYEETKRLWASYRSLNIQPTEYSLSIAAKNNKEAEVENSKERNLVTLYDNMFESLWKEYEKTNEEFPRASITYSGTEKELEEFYDNPQKFIKKCNLKEYYFNNKKGLFDSIICIDRTV